MTGEDGIGANEYAYCYNNPENYFYPMGTAAKWVYNGKTYNYDGSVADFKQLERGLPPLAMVNAVTVGYKGNYAAYKNAIGFMESSNNYKAKNGSHYGRYQMGSTALQDAGFLNSNNTWTNKAKQNGVYSYNDFLNKSQAQEVAFDAFLKKLWSYICNYNMDLKLGFKFKNVVITKSGLIAACHLVGTSAMKTGFEKDEEKYDGNKTPASKYLDTFGGYNMADLFK